MTGADSPVIADSSTDATPSMISPSAGMNSPALTMTTSFFRRVAAGNGFRRGHRQSGGCATVSVRVLRSVSACALPRPSAIASAKLAKSTVNQSQNATWPVNSGRPPLPGELLHQDDRRQQAADLDDEHHRVLDLKPRIELAERIGDGLADDRRVPDEIVRARVVDMSLSTLRCVRVEREIQLEHVHARAAEKPERRRLGVLGESARGRASTCTPRAAATRAACSSAAAGGICGSRPAPLAVTISDGTCAARDAFLLR